MLRRCELTASVMSQGRGRCAKSSWEAYHPGPHTLRGCDGWVIVLSRGGFNCSPRPGMCALSLPLGWNQFWRSHPEARLELLQNWSWGTTGQPGWKENLLGVGVMLGAPGHAASSSPWTCSPGRQHSLMAKIWALHSGSLESLHCVILGNFLFHSVPQCSHVKSRLRTITSS